MALIKGYGQFQGAFLFIAISISIPTVVYRNQIMAISFSKADPWRIKWDGNLRHTADTQLITMSFREPPN
jgi:hypothetical protein